MHAHKTHVLIGEMSLSLRQRRKLPPIRLRRNRVHAPTLTDDPCHVTHVHADRLPHDRALQANGIP
jgi:hypothetical protein